MEACLEMIAHSPFFRDDKELKEHIMSLVNESEIVRRKFNQERAE
jgi:hypothetical protein